MKIAIATLALVCAVQSGMAVISIPVPSHIVMLQNDADPEAVAADFNLTPSNVYRHALKGFAATIPPGMLHAFKADARVIAVESNGPIFPAGQTNATGIRRIGIPGFPLAHINGVDERIDLDVAVMDTGIQSSHPDLNVVHAVGFADLGLNGEDWSGHGTHVAGILGALDNNIGVVGVAPGVRLWSVQVLGPTQSGWNNFFAGMDYIAQHAGEISVVNASLSNNGSGPAPEAAIRQAISNLVSLGVVFVTCAGNASTDIYGPDATFGTDDDFLPAAIPEAMTVSALDDADGLPGNDHLAASSCFSQSVLTNHFVNSPGAAIDVAAPGVNIYSTWIGSTYSTQSGTSMAAPHVAGLVALYIAANGRATNAAGVYQIRQAIVDNAQPQSAWQTVNTSDPDTNHEGLAIASLNWVPRQRFLSQQITPLGFAAEFTTLPGYTHTVQFTADLTAINAWTDLAVTNGTGKPVFILDSATNVSRFYRLLTNPAP